MQRSTVGYNTKIQDFKASENGKAHEMRKVHNYNKIHEYGSTNQYKLREYKPTSLEYKPTNNNNMGRNKPHEKKVKRLKHPNGPKKPRRRVPDYRPSQLDKSKTIKIGPEYKIHQYGKIREYKGTEYRSQPYQIKHAPEYQSKEYRPHLKDYKLTPLNFYGFYDRQHGDDRPDVLPREKPRSADKVSVSDVKVRPRDENVPPGYQQKPHYKNAVIPAAVVGAAAVNRAPKRPLNETNDYKVKNYDKYREYDGYREYKLRDYTGNHSYNKLHEYDHIHEYCLFNRGEGRRRPIMVAQAAAADPEQKAEVAKEQEQKESGVKMKPSHDYDKIHEYNNIHAYQSKDYVPNNNRTIAPAALAGGAAVGYVATKKQSQPLPNSNKAVVKKTGEGKSKDHAFDDWSDSKKKAGPTASVIPVSNNQKKHKKKQENKKEEETTQKTRTKTPPKSPPETRRKSPPRNEQKIQHESSNNYQPRYNDNAGIVPAAAMGAATGVAMSQHRTSSPKPQNTRPDSPPQNTRNIQNNSPINNHQRYNDHSDTLAAAATGAAAATMIQPSNNQGSPSKVPADDWADTRAPSPKAKMTAHPEPKQADDWMDTAKPQSRPTFAAAPPSTSNNIQPSQGLPPEVQAAIRAYDEAHSRKVNTPQVPAFKDDERRVSSVGHAHNKLPRDVVAKLHAYNRIRVH